jgi:hypothetical protein
MINPTTTGTASTSGMAVPLSGSVKTLFKQQLADIGASAATELNADLAGTGNAPAQAPFRKPGRHHQPVRAVE